jgi:transmembrane sensor
LYRKLAQGSTAIQINNGITYTTGITAKAKTAYNTLSTAIGEQSPYPLILSDGSKVWLNAQSSITFPTAFNGKERIVKIIGEALFEVAHNTKQPFKVLTDKQTIEDIGTTFDVNAYADEPTAKTTLIEGKVKVNGMFLEPGQQSDGSHIKTVNTKRFIAWKSGDFYFEDDNIQTVMRQLSRWYNIEISSEGDVTTNGFNAQISRSKNISAILHILENTKGVHFKIEGRRVTVIE